MAVSRWQSPGQRTTFCAARSYSGSWHLPTVVASWADHSGRGYAIEAARVVLGVAFGEFGPHRVTGSCDARNLASARLMERLGMRREAHFRSNEYVKDEWCDELVYAILREEWVVR